MIDKHLIEKKVNEGCSIRNLSKIFNLSYTAIRYVLKKYNLKTKGNVGTNNWDIKSLKKAISKAECKSDVLKQLGIKVLAGNYSTLENVCKKYKINISHLIYKNDRGNKFINKLTNSELFVENSITSRTVIKARIIKYNLIKFECVECKNDGIWNGKKLSLQLDHINSINNDNRLENLRFLCPNCHSQTTSFNRNKGAVAELVKASD